MKKEDTLSNFLVESGAMLSKAECRRIGQANAIKVNGTVISDPDHFLVREDDVVQIGRKPENIYYVDFSEDAAKHDIERMLKRLEECLSEAEEILKQLRIRKEDI